MSVFAWNRLTETSDDQIFATYLAFEGQYHNLLKSNAPDSQWHVFQSQVDEYAIPIIAELEGSATSDKPLRRQLLFLSRDLFPDMLSHRGDPDRESKVRQNLADTDVMLNGGQPSPQRAEVDVRAFADERGGGE